MDKINELLAKYRVLINFKDQTQRGNFKFVESYVKHAKKYNAENWIQDSIWFIGQAINLHQSTLGKLG